MGRNMKLGSGGSCRLGVFFVLSLLGTPARDKWHRHKFYHLRITLKWRWNFPVRRTRQKVELNCTDRSWDLQMRTVIYVDTPYVFF